VATSATAVIASLTMTNLFSAALVEPADKIWFLIKFEFTFPLPFMVASFCVLFVNIVVQGYLTYGEKIGHIVFGVIGAFLLVILTSNLLFSYHVTKFMSTDNQTFERMKQEYFRRHPERKHN
jgi:hypothetical protein